MKKLLLLPFLLIPHLARAQEVTILQAIKSSFQEVFPILWPLFAAIVLVISGAVWFVRKLRS